MHRKVCTFLLSALNSHTSFMVGWVTNEPTYGWKHEWTICSFMFPSVGWFISHVKVEVTRNKHIQASTHDFGITVNAGPLADSHENKGFL